MSEKTFVAIFLTVTILASGFIIMNKLSQPSPSTSTSDNLNFQTNSSPSSSTTPTPTPTGIQRQFNGFPSLSPDQLKNKKATIQTDKGTIEFDISPEATKAASSFIFLANNHFFDGLTFHRVESGFVIQGGDPNGNGTGGPGYSFTDEPILGTYTQGTVAMANAGPNTNGSQFFILLADHPELPKLYTIFGHVSKGMDMVSKIQKGDIMRKIAISSQ